MCLSCFVADLADYSRELQRVKMLEWCCSRIQGLLLMLLIGVHQIHYEQDNYLEANLPIEAYLLAWVCGMTAFYHDNGAIRMT